MKKLLVVVDFQNDFVTGSLGFKEALLLEDRVVARIKEAIDEGFDIAYTMDTHFDNYQTTVEGRNLPIIHCLKNSDGWQLTKKISACLRKEDKIFLKESFASELLFEHLKKSQYEYVELLGLVTNICLIANAVMVKTALLNARVVINSNLTASFDYSLHLKALDVLKGLHVEVL